MHGWSSQRYSVRILIKELVSKYVRHHDFLEQHVLAPLRACASFAEYDALELPDWLRLRTFETALSPSAWLEAVLPAEHVEMLRKSLEGSGSKQAAG